MVTPLITFGLISDCQYANEYDETYMIPTPERLSYDCRYRESPNRLRQAVNFFNTQHLDFVVHLGDFIDRRFDDIAVLTDITNTSEAPFWHVLGNHEYKDKTKSIKDVLSAYAMPSRYYVKDIATHRFIVIDSNEKGVISSLPNSESYKKGEMYIHALMEAGRVNAYRWNGGIDAAQFAWIESQIQDAEKRDMSVIIFSHHPVFPPGPLNMLNDIEFLKMISRYTSVKAFFNGHNHLGAYGYRDNIPYVTSAGIVEGDGNAYSIVRLFKDGTGSVTGYGRQESYSW